MAKQKSCRQAEESDVKGSLLTADVAVDDVAAVVRSAAVIRMMLLLLGSVASVSVRFGFGSERSRTRGSGMGEMAARLVIRVSVDNCKTVKVQTHY